MPRSLRPNTPDDDIAAHRTCVEDTGCSAVLTPELAAFCQSGISVIVASCLPDGRPVSGLGFACRVLPSGTMRILLSPAASEPVLDAVKKGGAFAVTFSQPTTHRSIQIKSRKATIAAPDDADRKAARLQCAHFRTEMISVGYSLAFSSAYCDHDPLDMIAIDLAPEHAFVQTPGPGAGTELQP